MSKNQNDQIRVVDMTLCAVCGEFCVIMNEENREVCLNCLPELQ